MIENGFGLTMGKLDPLYGEDGQEIRFGIKNQLDVENIFDGKNPVAYIEFFDLRGLPSEELSESEYHYYIKMMRKERTIKNE